MREHKNRLKHYLVIVRNAMSPGMSHDVDICINLPGILDSCKHIFWASVLLFFLFPLKLKKKLNNFLKKRTKSSKNHIVRNF